MSKFGLSQVISDLRGCRYAVKQIPDELRIHFDLRTPFYLLKKEDGEVFTFKQDYVEESFRSVND